jgi:hypothetical protein
LLDRSSAQQAADAKHQLAKEMKAKANAYADAASPIKKSSSTASLFPQATDRILPAALSTTAAASSAQRLASGT